MGGFLGRLGKGNGDVMAALHYVVCYYLCVL